MGRPRWGCAAVGLVLSTVGLARGQSLPVEGDLSVQSHKTCLRLLDNVWKGCRATDSETKALCSSECEAAIRTALVHQECSNVVVTSSMTFDQSVQSHVNFHAYHCLPDEPADTAVSHAPGARRTAALRARPLDPKVANECFVHEDRSDYRGFVNTTLSGYTCQKWTEQFPHHHSHAPSESNSWQGLGDHNYCRALSWDSCAWCYTTAHTPKWECCLIGSPQPSCPRKAFMPAADGLNERERKVLDELTAGNCPRMLIMLKLAPIGHAAGKSGWYEVVSESSAGLDGRESYQLSGHHLTLPGTVKQTVLGRVNANDGVFRCNSEGLFFEPTTAGGAAAPASRVRIYSASVPQLNASIIQVIEFKPGDDDAEDALPPHEERPLPWWRRLPTKLYVFGGLGIYVGSMGLCAMLAYLVAKGGRSMVAPRSPGARTPKGARPPNVTWREGSQDSAHSGGGGGLRAQSPGSALPADGAERARERGGQRADGGGSAEQARGGAPARAEPKARGGVRLGGGCKQMMVPFFRWLGTAVARNPWRTVALSSGFALALTAGLVRMHFEADSSLLFLPQRTDMAAMRHRYASTFGSMPDVIMMVVKRRAGGSMINRASLTSATQLYKQVVTLDALPKGAVCPDDPTGRAACGAHADPIELNEFCVNWYVAQLGDYMCSVDSILELWKYEFGPINADEDVERTLYHAYKERRVELGAAAIVNDASQRVTTDAFMLSFFLNTSTPAYSNGRYAIWHAKLRDSINLIAQREALEVSWWSTRLNEDEAGSFVQKDAPLLAFSFIAVIFYVSVSLSRISCADTPHTQQLAMGDDGAVGYVASSGGGSSVRIMLSLSCALCSALSMSSGFGLTALFGVPISPVTPLVSFMLLGVSVDNMIIIVDTFDRIDENEDIDVRLSMSLSESGTAITVTTFTTFVAFMTGLPVDLPVYSFFCTTAAACTGCLYVLQLTLFCALLVIDTQGRDQAARAYDEALFDNSAYAYEAAYGGGAHGYAQGSFAGPPLLQPGQPSSEHVGYAQGGPQHHPQPEEQHGGARGYGAAAGPMPSGYGDLYDYGAEYEQPPPRATAVGAHGGADLHGYEFYPPPPPGGYARNGAGRDGAPETPRGGPHAPSYAEHGPEPYGHAGAHAGYLKGAAGAYALGQAHAHGDELPRAPHAHVHLDPSLADERHVEKMLHIESQQPMMLAYSKWLMSPAVKVLILLLYLAPVVFAAFTVRDLKPGLPYRQTVPVNSIIMNFLDDVDQFYGGSFPVKLLVVFEDTTTDDFMVIREVLGEMLLLPDITRVYPDWMVDYGRWVQSFGQPSDMAGLKSMCNLRHFLDDAEFELADHPNTTLVPPLFSPRADRSGSGGQAHAAGMGRRLLAAPAGAFGEADWARQISELRRQLDERALAGGGGGGRRRLQQAADSALPEHGVEKLLHARAHPPEGSPAAELLASHEAAHGRAHPGIASLKAQGASAGSGGGGGGGRPPPACVNNEERFKSISGGHVCDSAFSHCVTGTGHAIVAKLCPVTCNLCDDATRLASASGANGTVEQDLVLGGKNFEMDVVLQELVAGGCDAPPPGASAAEAAAAQCAQPQSCVIQAQRFVVAADLDQTMEQSYFVWKALTEVFERVSQRHGRPIKGYAYHIRFEFGYFDHVIIEMGLMNLLAVVGVIAVCTLIFLPTFISILAVFTVVCIDLQLLSVMSLAGLNFNSISCISLLIALGLAIDYSVHIGHAYHMAPFDTREAKVKHALLTMGASILNAGGSTLLGTLFLALSDSAVFRTFFIFMWGTIFLGLFSGLAFAPIVLSIIGPIEAPPLTHRVDSHQSEHSDQPPPHAKYGRRRT